MIEVQASWFNFWYVFFIIFLLFPHSEAAAAGTMWRRYERAWPVIVGYGERIIPLALAVVGTTFTVPSVFEYMDSTDGWPTICATTGASGCCWAL